MSANADGPRDAASRSINHSALHTMTELDVECIDQATGSGKSQNLMQKAARWPCGVCGRGVGGNSIQCTSYQKWVHKKCSGIKGSMSEVTKSFVCRGCLNPATSTGRTSVDIGSNANLELVELLLS